jgi:CrcB protein
MWNLIIVFIGGGIGTAARYLVSGWVYQLAGSSFPYGTFVENVVGCFLIGLSMAALDERFLLNPTLRIFLTIGILGGFTTFSTFSYETIAMLKDAEYFTAFVNVGSTLITCLGATYLGMVTGKLF